MKFNLMHEKEFLNPYYRKKPILENELNHFTTILKDYKINLQNNLKNNEDSIVANALSKFFEILNFECEVKSIHKGNSGIDLALKKEGFTQVIIEAKLPHSKEFFNQNKPNCKALHECILYYLRERKALNSSIKHIIITDFYKFYIFKADGFEELFNKNKHCKEAFENFESKNSLFKGNTDEFYKEMKELLNSPIYLQNTLKGIFVDLEPILNEKQPSFNTLKPLFKIFNKACLLSEFNPNDANSLNNAFYKELLYILGLCESKKNSKFIIEKSEQSEQEQGTFYTAINSKLKEENFETILKLLILWLNRILFLKLIESNLVRFNDDKNLKFLNFKKIPDFDKLSELFFEILAKEKNARKKSEFSYLPYLNSSLFEKQDIENTLEISSLSNDLKLDYYKHTVLKDEECKIKKGQVKFLEYLFEFLDSFDFGSDDEQSELLSQKELINSSVLGNVFEKLNGYKEGSFYTPSFITSYMCKESITKVVLDKFNAKFDLDAKDLKELRTLLRKEDKNTQKELLNSIRICDPAVGSGHFLVSALNVMLSIYDELNLFDEEFYLEVQNDEILISNRKGEFIEYKRPNSKKDKTHLIQQELFNTKKQIIENNLFGVDINPNSCEITKLRLWIELLKHSYYQSFENEHYHDLKTLPNVDINIKCGNSLISKMPINEPLFLQTQEDIKAYKKLENEYYHGFYLDKKDHFNKIDKMKSKFIHFYRKEKYKQAMQNLHKKCEQYAKDYEEFALDELTQDYAYIKAFIKNYLLTHMNFNLSINIDETKAKEALKSLKKAHDEIFDGFEWRVEFSKILHSSLSKEEITQNNLLKQQGNFKNLHKDKEGDFLGFDLIIGNPPYIKENDNKEIFTNTKKLRTYQGKMDIWYHFVGRGFDVLKENGILSFIATNNWVTNQGAKKLRNIVLEESQILNLIDFSSFMVFDSASIQTMIMEFKKTKPPKNYNFHFAKITTQTPNYEDAIALLNNENSQNNEILNINFTPKKFIDKTLNFAKSDYDGLFEKIQKYGKFYLDEKEVAQGIVPNPDVITKRNINDEMISCGIKIGDGVFVIEKDSLNVSENEKKYLKPLYEVENFDRYYFNVNNSKQLIYTTKTNCTEEDIPTIISHLNKFRVIMDNRRENLNKRLEFYHLHWARDKKYFESGEKIISVRKCINPIFSYLHNEAYVMLSLNIIKTQRINLKYLTGLLNSKLIAFWLKHKGKMQGNNYQIDKEPLLNIPIVDINSKNEKLANELVNLVDEILKAKEKDKNANTSSLEEKINNIVYKLYNLSEEEIKIIEGK